MEPSLDCRHTHIARDSNAYYNDSLRLFDEIFHHDDNVPQGQLGTAFEKTVQLFQRRFPEAGAYNPAPTQVRPYHSLKTMQASLIEPL